MARKLALAVALGCLLVAVGLWAGLGLRVQKDVDGQRSDGLVEPSASSEPGPVELIDAPGMLLEEAPGQVPSASRAEVPIPAQVSSATRAAQPSTPSKRSGSKVINHPRFAARILDASGQPLQNRPLKLYLRESTGADRNLYLGRGTTDGMGLVEFRGSRSSSVGKRGIPLIEEKGSEAYAFFPNLISVQIGIQDLGTLVLQEEFQRDPNPLLQAWVVDLQGQPVDEVSASVGTEDPRRSSEEEAVQEASAAELLTRLRQTHRQVRTRPGGLVQVFGVSAEPLELIVSATGFRTHSGTYQVPQRALQIVLERRQWVFGRVACDADIWSQADFEVCLCTANPGEPGSGRWSKRELVSSERPLFFLESGPGAMEIQVRDESSAALLYRSALNLIPERNLDLGTLDLRGRIRPFQVRFQRVLAAAGEPALMLACWEGHDSSYENNFDTNELELDFSESGEAILSGYIPSDGARFEVWLQVGQYLAKWQTFDALALPDPLLVPSSVSPDDCSEFISVLDGTAVPRRELKLDVALDLDASADLYEGF